MMERKALWPIGKICVSMGGMSSAMNMVNDAAATPRPLDPVAPSSSGGRKTMPRSDPGVSKLPGAS